MRVVERFSTGLRIEEEVAVVWRGGEELDGAKGNLVAAIRRKYQHLIKALVDARLLTPEEAVRIAEPAITVKVVDLRRR